MNELPLVFRELLVLLDIKSFEEFGLRVLAAIVICLVAYSLSRILQRIIGDRLSHDSHKDEYTISIYKRIVRSAMILICIFLSLYALGFNMSSLFTAGSLLAVAMAFATKEIVENYVAGVMLRMERIIKPGDVLEINGIMVKLKSIGIRATWVRTEAELDLLVPNSQLIKDKIANYTYKDSTFRLDTKVGVPISSDLKQVQEVLTDVSTQLGWVSSQYEPRVLISDIGHVSVNFKVSVWMENPWQFSQRYGQLNDAIWWGLKKANIFVLDHGSM